MNQRLNSVVVLPLEQDSEVLLRPIEDCLTPKLKEVLFEMSAEVRGLPLVELEDRLTITPVLSQIKLRFWQEYTRTIDQGRKSIEINSMLDGVCTKQYFFSYVVHREEMFAWLFHPPTNFETAAEESLNYGLPKIREMLDAPLFKKLQDGSKGDFIPANAAAVLQAVKFLDARVKGSPLQRIEQKSLHLHKNADNMQKGITRDELDEEIRLLSQRLGGDSLQIEHKVPDETE